MFAAQEAVGAGDVAVDAHVVGDDDGEVSAAGETRFEEVAVTLDGHRHGRLVEAIGAVADTPATAASAERQDLPESIEDEREHRRVVSRRLEVLFDDLREGERDAAGEPASELVFRAAPEGSVAFFELATNLFESLLHAKWGG